MSDRFLEQLLVECGVKGQRRNVIVKSVKQTGAFPKLSLKKESAKAPEPKKLTVDQIGRLKTLQQIMSSDAYEVEKFVPKVYKSRDLEKKKLFETMTGVDYIDDLKTVKKKRSEPKIIEPSDEFDDILMEIQERQEWLQEMTELGAGEQYRTRITTEIQQRIRRLEQIDLIRSKQ